MNDLHEEEILINFLITKKNYSSYDEIASMIFHDLTFENFTNKNNQNMFQCLEYLYTYDMNINTFSISKYFFDNYEIIKKDSLKIIYSYNDHNAVAEKDYISEIVFQIQKNNKILEIINFFKQFKDNIEDHNLETIYDKLDDLLTKITHKKEKDFVSIADSSSKILRDITNKAERNSFLTGFEKLDKLTNGFNNGNLIIIAARPSFGKTAFAINIVKNIIAETEKKSVLFVSLEMSHEDITKRFLSSMTGIQMNKIITKNLNKNEFLTLEISKNVLKKYNVFFNVNASISVNELAMIAKNINKQCPLKLIVIDYLQLMECQSKSRFSREQEVSSISRKLKLLARHFDIPIIAISQLSRRLETRENKRPNMSDLRESGAIEQDADIVIFLYRDQYYENLKNKKDNISNDQEEIELILAKHRNGPIGNLLLTFYKSINLFK